MIYFWTKVQCEISAREEAYFLSLGSIPLEGSWSANDFARREEMSQRREYNRTFIHLEDRYGGLMTDEQLIKCILMFR